MSSGDIEKDIRLPTDEEEAYLDKYFPKGDARRGDALVIFAFMKRQQLKMFEKFTEICGLCNEHKAIQWVMKEGKKLKICEECLDDLIDEGILEAAGEGEI